MGTIAAPAEPPDIGEAFALTDNPFVPKNPIPGVENPLAVNMLALEGLQILKEPGLLKFFCDQAGPFENLLNRFWQKMKIAGYRTNPPRLGITPWVILVRGPQGTGKTSLVHRMVHWLVECSCGNLSAKTWPQPGENLPSAAKQQQSIEEFDQRMIAVTPPRKHCCFILEDLVEGAELGALKMFGHFISDRIVIMFLISSDPPIIGKDYAFTKYPLVIYDTAEMTPDNAVAFARHRIGEFRSAQDGHLIKSFPLFPFAEPDIRAAVISQLRESCNGKNAVTLRTFNKILGEAIDEQLAALPPDFRIISVPQNDWEKHLIDPAKAFKKKMGLDG